MSCGPESSRRGIDAGVSALRRPFDTEIKISRESRLIDHGAIKAAHLSQRADDHSDGNIPSSYAHAAGRAFGGTRRCRHKQLEVRLQL